MIYSLLADAVLVVHALFVAFVVLMLPCIAAGGLFGWRWVRTYWLRVAHLAAIGFVTLQTWAGVICPLTTLEMWLAQRGQRATYTGSFIQHWLQQILYWDFPAWVFIAAYSGFALLVITAWYGVPPERTSKRNTPATK
jgi:Protein of Unknown function (DUF2784)